MRQTQTFSENEASKPIDEMVAIENSHVHLSREQCPNHLASLQLYEYQVVAKSFEESAFQRSKAERCDWINVIRDWLINRREFIC